MSFTTIYDTPEHETLRDQVARFLAREVEGRADAWEEQAFRQPILEQYEVQGHPYYATGRLWDDGVIDPADTRRVLALGLSASLNAPIPEPKFGVFRM